MSTYFPREGQRHLEGWGRAEAPRGGRCGPRPTLKTKPALGSARFASRRRPQWQIQAQGSPGLRPSSANQPREPRLLGQMGLAFQHGPRRRRRARAATARWPGRRRWPRSASAAARRGRRRAPGWSNAAKSASLARRGSTATASRWDRSRWVASHECRGQPQAFRCSLAS